MSRCPVCGQGELAWDDSRKREVLVAMLETIYTLEGISVWLADAGRKGWTLDEQLQRAEQLVTGAVA